MALHTWKPAAICALCAGLVSLANGNPWMDDSGDCEYQSSACQTNRPAASDAFVQLKSQDAIMHRKPDESFVQATANRRHTSSNHVQVKSKSRHSSSTHFRSGVGKMLLDEVKTLASGKGRTPEGLDAEEQSHLQQIYDLLENSVLPGLLEGHRESLEELMEFYQAVLDCQVEVSTKIKMLKDLEEEVIKKQKEHEECRELEEFWYTEKERDCRDFETFKMNLKQPESVPVPESAPQVMADWLAGMNEYYCPIWEIFDEKWEECEETEKNYTKIREECNEIQEEYELEYCTLRTRVNATCETYQECWTESVSRYNERKEALEALMEEQKSEYEAVTQLECLWEAWDFNSSFPCVINETREEECAEIPVNTSNFTIDFPEVPDPITCPDLQTMPDMSEVDNWVHPCQEGWIAEQYITLGLDPVILDEIRENCRRCTGEPPEEPLELSQGTHTGLLLQSIAHPPSSKRTSSRALSSKASSAWMQASRASSRASHGHLAKKKRS